MWIVRVALDRPYTFFVMAIAMLLFGVMAGLSIPTDIFPNINIPVVAVVWTYSGMLPADMSGRVVYYFERELTTQVNDVKTIDSQSMIGYGVIKIYFQSSVNINAAIAQTTAAAQTILKLLPAGMTPPYVLEYSAGTVPVVQVAMSGKDTGQVALFDLAENFVRPQLASVAGAAVPSPYGGLYRSIMADLNIDAMQTYNVSPQDVVRALEDQNLVIPAGTEKIGQFENYVEVNGSPVEIRKLNDMPVKRANGTVIYLRDVAYVHNGAPPQTNLVRMNGEKAALIPVFKIGTASTLAITGGISAKIPKLKEQMPKGLDIRKVGDQASFVRGAIEGVVREGTIAAVLTALMILLFLGSWRSTLIIAVSIPLAVLTAVVALWGIGESLNVMTSGGLALAVGMLVDDATVTIENINVHLEQGLKIRDAILKGAAQIAIPALVSVLSISIVFVPMFALSGVSHYLFMPMAEAVIFALLASYLLSRTLVPTMAMYLLRVQEKEGAKGEGDEGGAGPDGEHTDGDEDEDGEDSQARAAPGRVRRGLSRAGGAVAAWYRASYLHRGLEAVYRWLGRFQKGFEDRFNRLGARYKGLLAAALDHPALFLGGFVFVIVASLFLEPLLGRDFFPHVYGDEIMLHVRAHTGTRIEQTARLCDEVEATIRKVVGSKDVQTIVDNIDLPYSGINLAYTNTGTIGPQDADITVALAPGHGSTEGYIRKLRARLPGEFPGTTFSFLPADITSQVLNFGLPSPIDVQVSGTETGPLHKYAIEILHRIERVPGVTDARIQQRFDYPQINIDVDRTLAKQVGVDERNVSESMMSMLSGSFQVKPNFWLEVKTGVEYPLEAMAPQYRIDSMPDLYNVPITGTDGQPKQILGALGSISRGPADGVVSHYNVQPVVDIYASYDGRDLGSIDDDIQRILRDTQKHLPKGADVAVRGQVSTMREAYGTLFPGIAGAVALVYLLVVVNFQSWLDPFVIVTGLPAALAGIVWALFVTFTPISVPALTGTIMCMGIATANSVLVISFAREQLAGGARARDAALEAGETRLRPVIMTATAMIIGMLPMSLGLGEGGAQNAPLGRAVIGGLSFATISTLFFVPVVFSLMHRNDRVRKRRGGQRRQGDRGNDRGDGGKGADDEGKRDR
jgi:multidrug efflux pump subunit AcrB